MAGVRGVAGLRALAKRLRVAAGGMPDDIRDGVQWAVKPLDRSVRKQIGRVMPGGYAHVLGAAWRTQVSATKTGVTVTGYARGRAEERDVVALDRGRLRHPLFGDREWWYGQTVRPGFWSGPVEDTAGKVEQRVSKVLDNIARKIAEG